MARKRYRQGFSKDFSDLKDVLQVAINMALEKPVAEHIKSVQSKHIQSDVYDTYEPKEYDRRYENSGLGDESNIISTLIEDGVLEVENVTLANPYVDFDGKSALSKNNNEYLTPIIETGEGYDFSFEHSGKPRSFIKNTREEINEDGKIKNILMSELRKLGFKVRR